MHPFASIEYGDAQQADITIVFIHGWLDNAASFDVLMQQLYLQKKNIHLYAFDLPGHGLSPSKGDSYFYPFHDYLDDVNQVFTTLSTKSCILVGHSLGGLIASCYSAAFPENVIGLVQIEGKGPLSESPHFSLNRLRKGLENRARMRRKSRKGYLDYASALVHRSKSTHLPTSLIEPIVERGLKEQGGRWFWRADPKLSCPSLYRMSHEHAQEIMTNIFCPYHIILGNHGFEYLRDKDDVIRPKHSVIHTVAGGHHCHLESPEEVGQIILELINIINNNQLSQKDHQLR